MGKEWKLECTCKGGSLRGYEPHSTASMRPKIREDPSSIDPITQSNRFVAVCARDVPGMARFRTVRKEPLIRIIATNAAAAKWDYVRGGG
ncbi:hypothetical protein CDAR_31181 [Caerostris darwini]|uniref:Uncharacterized protein n=1 Tax=Caerostris darwini TaxID=1538125 RepID=A0AAV4N372_9ARAC|nr:hypothetical protein CDAR_31181 [Caerostris darwini]